MDHLTFYTILIVALPIQVCMFYAIYTLSRGIKKIYKCVDKGTTALIGAFNGAQTAPRRAPIAIDKELISNVIQVIKKVI